MEMAWAAAAIASLGGGMRHRPPERRARVSRSMAQIVTASRLTDGAVVFLDGDGGWTERLDRSRVFADKAGTAAGLEAGQAAEARSLVIDVYAVDVALQAGVIVPTKLREAIRARGPTIHPEFTKPGSTGATVQEDDHVSV